ncbi:hypothetical protein BDR05DRAFT_1036868 [Suillus weaverae]|nr:hypothetical protein BDR05DRAFT_1036868 [Suillus weaverae]
MLRANWQCNRDHAARNTLVIMGYEGNILWNRRQQLHFQLNQKYLNLKIHHIINQPEIGVSVFSIDHVSISNLVHCGATRLAATGQIFTETPIILVLMEDGDEKIRTTNIEGIHRHRKEERTHILWERLIDVSEAKSLKFTYAWSHKVKRLGLEDEGRIAQPKLKRLQLRQVHT